MCEEMMPYRKKSQKKAPSKANHKHHFEPCIIEYMGERLERGRGFIPDAKTAIKSYCPVCGKLSSELDYSIWYKKEIVKRCWYNQPTERLLQELDPNTRTLPTFWVDDYWKQKYVELRDTSVEDAH